MALMNVFTFFVAMVSFLCVTDAAFIIRNSTGQDNAPSLCDDLYKGLCYNVFTNEMSAPKAEKKCNDKGPDGHLVAFHTQEDVDFIKNLIIKKDVPRAWIGARWKRSYDFTDGTTYTDYVQGRHGGYCVAMLDTGTLHARLCNQSLPYICQTKGATSCPDDFTQLEGSCYRRFQYGKNFYDAERDCNEKGGHLAAWQPDEQLNNWASLTTPPP